MNNVTQIINALKPIAQKLGEGGQQLYKAYYHQTIINGVESLIVSLVILIGLVLIGRYVSQATKTKPKSKFSTPDDFTPDDMKGVVIAILVVIGVMTLFWGIIPGINDLLNPNYQTIQNIISQIG